MLLGKYTQTARYRNAMGVFLDHRQNNLVSCPITTGSPESRKTAKEGDESKGRNGQNGQRNSTKGSHRIAHRESLLQTICVK